MDVLTAQLREQAAQIQKVSTQIGISRSTTKVTTLAKQEDQIRALTSGLQKVTAQMEASRPAPQIVLSYP